MRAARTWVVAALVGSCAGEAGPEPTAGACEDAPTWHSFAEGYVRTWCTPCHSASVSGPDRQGAPAGVDFDRWSQVYALRDRVAARATGEAPDMPPAGGVDPAQTALLEAWLVCGAEGSDPAPGPCEAPVAGGPAVVRSQADADAVCARGGAASSLEVDAEGPIALDCLCAVDGDVVVAGGEVSGARLVAIGGDLQVTGGAVGWPALAEVGGRLTVTGDAAAVDVPALAAVGGDVSVEDTAALEVLSLDGLVEVGGAVRVARGAVLARVDLPRLRTIGGDAVFDTLPALVALDGTRALEAVGGDLVLTGLTRWPVLDDWAFLLLASVGGDVIVRENDALVAIHGLTVLPTLGGDLVIEGNDTLVRIEGLDNLTAVGGDLRIRGNPRQQSVFGLVNLAQVSGTLDLEALPALSSIGGLEDLQQVGALRLSRVGLPVLAGLPDLVTIDGALTIDTCDALQRVDGLRALRTVGAVAITSNPALSGIVGLGGVTDIAGDVVVTDNPALSTAAVEAWLGGIAVGGDVAVSGNGQ